MADRYVKDSQIEASPQLTDHVFVERVGGAGIQPKLSLVSSLLALFQANGLYIEDSETSITASGTNQSNATVISKVYNYISTSVAGAGVKPSITCVPNFKMTIINDTVNDFFFYPFGSNHLKRIGETAMANSAPVTIYAGTYLKVFCFTAGELIIIS